MRYHPIVLALALLPSSAVMVLAFAPQYHHHPTYSTTTTSTTTSPSSSSSSSSSALGVSIGLGPQEEAAAAQQQLTQKKEGIDYEVPNHEEYRTVRRSKIDEECDEWFQKLFNGPPGCLASDNFAGLAQKAHDQLTTPVPLVNDLEKPTDHEEWTPYVSTKLPWTPLVPAFGTEVFGLPVPRRNAETWRHFDVSGMVRKQYPMDVLKQATTTLNAETVQAYQTNLQSKGAWLNDEECQGRLVYINGQFVPELSMTTPLAQNLDGADSSFIDDEQDNKNNNKNEIVTFLGRLTDGFTDELAAPVPFNDKTLTSYKKLSVPDHNMGEPYSQFAINSQQGTACFAALNTYKTQGVALIQCPAHHDGELGDHDVPKPVLIVNAQTADGGCGGAAATDSTTNGNDGVAYHPRTLVIAQEGSRLSVVQSSVDLDMADNKKFVPKLYNGYTQVFIKGKANVTHSYLEESDGMVTPDVEKGDEEFPEGVTPARAVEAQRHELQDTHLEAIDVHIMGEEGVYQGTVMAMGGNGHSRVALSVSLLQTGAHATVNGFSLAGGAQRTDIKTNIHHVAQGTTSRQLQKNMVGGRATGSFRGRIRVEQSAQQTDSEQLSRTILLSDKARAWAVPSLEIIADDVKCAHGATVSDLSEEELFYLRSRGLDSSTARNMLMYAFADDIASCIDPAMLGSVDGKSGLQKRVIQRLENLVPRGNRAIAGEFQSI